MMMWEIGEMLIASVGKQFVLHLGRIQILEEDFWGAQGSGYEYKIDCFWFLFCWVLILLGFDFTIRFQNVHENGCGFFRWYDPPICPRSKIIIPGLVRKIHELESQVRAKLTK